MVGVKGQVQARGVERRRAIVEAAAELFSRAGYRGTSLANIAERVGIARSAIVHHFGSKEKLLVAVLAAGDEQAMSQLSSSAASTAREAFMSWVEVARWCEQERTLALLSARLQAEDMLGPHPAHTYFATRRRTVFELLEAMLRQGVESGELRADLDVEAKAAEMQAFGAGAQFVWLKNPEGVDLTGLFHSYFEAQYELLRGRNPDADADA